MTESTQSEPTQAYFKAKRNLLVCAGILLAHIYIGLPTPSKGSSNVSLFPFSISDWQNLDFALSILVLFFLVQTTIFWAAQPATVRQYWQYATDYLLTMTIAFMSLVAMLGTEPIDLLLRSTSSYLEPLVDLLNDSFFFTLSTAVFYLTIGSVFFVLIRKLFSSTVEKTELIEMRDERLTDILSGNRWTLHFDPIDEHGKKLITFHKNGMIGEGRNHNETDWRINNGLLEILNPQNRVYSRFNYNRQKRRFEHTNDKDTLSLPNQVIVPIIEKGDA